MDTGKIYNFLYRAKISGQKYALKNNQAIGKILKKWDKNFDPNFVQMFPRNFGPAKFLPP